MSDAHLADGPSATEGRLTCPRCGTFVDAILDAPIEVCRDCAGKILIEPLREPLTFGSAIRAVVALWLTIGPMAALITVAFELPGFALFTAAPNLPIQLQLAYGLVTLVAELAVLWMAHEALHGRPVSVGEAFSRSLPRYGAVFTARWNAGIRTLLWLILLIVPGIYKGACYSISANIALFEHSSGAAAVETSITRTKDSIWTVLLVWGIPGFAMLAWVFGWGMASAFFVDVDASGAPINPWPIDLAIQVGTSLILLNMTLASQVFYEKLTLDARLAEA